MNFSGKKTYIIGGLSIVYAIAGVILGKHDYNTAASLIETALVSMTIRHGIK